MATSKKSSSVKNAKGKKNASSAGSSKSDRERKKTASSTTDIEEKEVSVDFEFFNMAEGDFHSVKQFLTGLFGASGHDVNLSALATLLTEDIADHVGTTTKTEGEFSDPYAITTLLPIATLSDAANGALRVVSKEVQKFLMDKVGGSGDGEALYRVKKALQAGSTALLINERLLNLPASIAVPMYEQLLKDLEHAMDEDTLFSLQNIILITSTYVEIESALDKELYGEAYDSQAEEEGNSGRVNSDGSGAEEEEKEEDNKDTVKRAKPGKIDSVKRIKRASSRSDQQSDLLHYQPENEFLPQFAEVSWHFKVVSPHTTSDSRRVFTDRGIEPSRTAFLLTLDSFKAFVQHIRGQL